MNNVSEKAGADKSAPQSDFGETDSEYRDRFLTIPNLICGFRILGSMVLVLLAIYGHPQAFVIGFIVLSLSDWIDGKLARWLNQQSSFGARLDSMSDATLYSCLLIGSLILKWEILRQEAGWLFCALASYFVTSGYGIWKFGRVPSYHTYGAKMTQWLVLGGAVALLMDWSVWPIRVAAVATVLTNMEATAMTYVLPEWRSDILTILHVLPQQKQKAE